VIDVEAYTVDEARAYLFERTGLHDQAGANILAEEVGRLPLALAQASAVIKAQHLSYSDFLDRLRKLPLDKYLTRQPGDAYPRGAAEAVILSVKQAEHRSKLSRALMLLLSILSPDGVSRELLYSAPVDRGVIKWPWRVGREASRAKIDEALEKLIEASLVTVSSDGQTVIMHRFTQRVIREHAIKQGVYPLIVAQASKFLAAQTNLVTSNRERLKVTEQVIQQVSSLWDNLAIKSAEDIDNIVTEGGYFGRWLGRRFATHLINLRIWSVAELNRTSNVARSIELGMSVMRECETLLGPDHLYTPASRNCLGIAFYNAGRFEEAIQLHQRTLADFERILGPDHPDTLTSRNNLGNDYHKAGQVEEAIELHQRTLADRERILGPDHPGTLVGRSNLASAYQNAGRVEEAIELHQRTLADFERILGPDHPHTLASRSQLASAYQNAGWVKEAIELHQRTLAARERILGPDHPDTLTSRDDLNNTQK
jgi:hypothetical protein